MFQECNPNFVLVALCLACKKFFDFLVLGLLFGHPYCFFQELTSARNLLVLILLNQMLAN